jgi:hypothetical protein
MPPDFDETVDVLKQNGMEIIASKKQYRPLFSYLCGLLLEPISKKFNHCVPGIWGYYGFEDIIWARKK